MIRKHLTEIKILVPETDKPAGLLVQKQTIKSRTSDMCNILKCNRKVIESSRILERDRIAKFH